MRSAGVLACAALALAGCSSRRAPVQMFSDMRSQPKYMPQAESAFFDDGRADRTPVPGTIPLGAAEQDHSQPPLTGELLARGRERFDIYCSPCHDRTGSGQGIVATRSSWLAANLTEDRIRKLPDAQIFDTITNGKRTMPAYRFQVAERDRWAIIAYVRALQRAAAGTIADVPPELRSELR